MIRAMGKPFNRPGILPNMVPKTCFATRRVWVIAGTMGYGPLWYAH